MPEKAYEDGNDNDAGFFSKMTENYRALIIDKIKEEKSFMDCIYRFDRISVYD